MPPRPSAILPEPVPASVLPAEPVTVQNLEHAHNEIQSGTLSAQEQHEIQWNMVLNQPLAVCKGLLIGRKPCLSDDFCNLLFNPQIRRCRARTQPET